MWNDRYSQKEYAYGKDANDFLVSMVDRLEPGGRVLEICAGEGRNAVFLAERGFLVTAVDGASAGIAKTQRLAQERGVSLETQVADMAAFNFGPPDSWDAIIAIFAHLPPELRKQVHGKIATHLKPGGVLLLEAYSPQQLERDTGGPPVLPMLMDLSEVQGELEGLEFDLAHEIEREIREGLYHQGHSSVIQIVAHKPGV